MHPWNQQTDGILVNDQQGRITGYNQNFMNMWNIPLDLLESGENDAVTNHVLPELKNPRRISCQHPKSPCTPDTREL